MAGTALMCISTRNVHNDVIFYCAVAERLPINAKNVITKKVKAKMTDGIFECFPCFRKKKMNWTLSENRKITGYDVIYIEVPEKDKAAFEEKRPFGKELCLSEFMALYMYVTEEPLPQPWYDCEYECYYFVNGDRIVIIQGWVPKKGSPWMRTPLTWIPKENINLVGKFKEPKRFGPAKKYEVSEYKSPSCDEYERSPTDEDKLIKKQHRSTENRPEISQNKPGNSTFTQLFP